MGVGEERERGDEEHADGDRGDDGGDFLAD